MDNDRDGLIDDETCDAIDSDGDGTVDEDCISEYCKEHIATW